MTDSTVLQLIAQALVHFVWQGTALAAALWLVLSFGRGLSARLHYTLGVTTLALMATCPVVTVAVISLDDAKGVTRPVDLVPAPTSPGLEQQFPMLGGIPILESHISEAHEIAPSTSHSEGSFAARPALDRWIVLFWIAGVFFFSCRWLWSYWSVRRFYRDTQTLPDPWPLRIQSLIRRVGISTNVTCHMSSRISSPAVVGWLKPRLLLPVSVFTGLTPEQLEAIVLHELAHVRRWDPWVNLLQSWLEVLLFFHPCVWWVSQLVRTQREYCCDDEAVQHCQDVAVYAEALTGLERLRTPPPTLALPANGASLMKRIERLLRPTTAQPRWQPAGGLLLLVVGFFFLGSAVLVTATPAPLDPPGSDLAPETNLPPRSESALPESNPIPPGSESGAVPPEAEPETRAVSETEAALAPATVSIRVLSVVANAEGGFAILQLENQNDSFDRVGPATLERGRKRIARLDVLSASGSLISAQLGRKTPTLRVGESLSLTSSSHRPTLRRPTVREPLNPTLSLPEEVRSGLPILSTLPMLRSRFSPPNVGKVLSVRDDLIAFRSSGNAPIEPGAKLSLARGATYLGEGTVVALERDMGMLRLTLRATDKDPQPGDQVILLSPPKAAEGDSAVIADPANEFILEIEVGERTLRYGLKKQPRVGQELLLVTGNELRAKLEVVHSSAKLTRARVTYHSGPEHLTGREAVVFSVTNRQ